MIPVATIPTRFLWLEITGRCQLTCVHCYADSSPQGGHGAMTASDWIRLIEDAAEHGIEMVQFIGGEPTVHPAFPDLVTHALAVGLRVEMFTNLYRVTPTLWDLFSRQPGVQLATSYYSDDPTQHDAITGRSGSHTRTRENIAEAVRRKIPLRVGIIGVNDAQRVDQARADLAALGVTDIGYDQMRAFGRGAHAMNEADTCGQCGHGTAAIGPDGTVSPCVFTRHAVVGNARREPLRTVLDSDAFRTQVAWLDQVRRSEETACMPNMKCGPRSSCQPSCTPSCSPLRKTFT
ncbi:radical SAM protein [Candidatus Protofrankia californiensis]|uniref:radical SAM protein n=1 Tax=Candidatus Protofrankia californiensis TaxID=1839754 RepID=UPI001041A986|nr:radical SAM protein [Candidatus Protofrankia californiensis]